MADNIGPISPESGIDQMGGPGGSREGYDIMTQSMGVPQQEFDDFANGSVTAYHARKGSLAVILAQVFGEDAFDDGADETARRVLAFWASNARPKDEPDFRFTTFPTTVNQTVIVKDIEFTSLCMHHLLPFYGVGHIAYIPNRLQVGLSKIPRLLDFFARRPQTQEVLTAQVAEYLKHKLEAHGVAVVLEARHTCMSCRGTLKYEASMVTAEMRGVFLTGSEARSEFMTLIGRSRL